MGSITRSFANNITTAGKFDGTKLTGDIPEANLSLNAPATDLQPIKSDITALALREATNESSASFNLPNQFIDTFATDTVGTKTDVTFDTGLLKTGGFSGTGSYVTGDRTSKFNVAAGTLQSAVSWYDNSESENRLFNGDTSTGNTNNSTYLHEGSTYTLSNVNLLTLNYGAATPACVDGWKFFGNNSNQGSASNPSGKFQGSADGGTWVDLKTVTNTFFQTSGAQTNEHTFTNNTAYQYYRWLGTSGSMSNTGWWYEIQLREKALVVNATGTAIQAANTVSSAKTKVGGTILYKDNAGTATLGTDLKIYFSCNGGSNWTEAASYNAITPVYSTGIKQVRLGETTCTSGTDVRYKVEWANQSGGSKETQLHGIGVNY